MRLGPCLRLDQAGVFVRNRPRNAAAVKNGNRLDLISLVLQGSVTRAELARRTGLTRAAVTIIVERLIRERVLSEAGETSDKQKHAARRLRINDQRYLFMGIDIHRQGYAIGLTDLRGQTVRSQQSGFLPGQPYERLMDQLSTEAEQMHRSLSQPDRLQGIGISVPGPVDHRTGAMSPPHFDLLKGHNILADLKDRLPAPVWIENNAAARALCEQYAGQERRYRNFMVLIVDTGIGSGLILNGKLYRGFGFAGEIGHLSIDRNGPLCACGNRGCLEGYAAIPALINLAAVPDSVVSWRDLADQAEAGDAGCLAAIEHEAANLAQGIVNAVNLLDLEAVILTGDIVYKPELLLQAVRRQVQATRITRQVHDLVILAAEDRQDAGMAGAAMIAMDHFFG